MFDFPLILLLSVIGSSICSGFAMGNAAWSPWYDSERTERGDNQTLERVNELYTYYCPADKIIRAQCRAKGNHQVFSDRDSYKNNWLRLPCNASGLLCQEEDQPGRQENGGNFTSGPLLCLDYEIRFECSVEDSTSSDSDVDSSLTINGGFIAMAAGLSVVIPLICVLIIQLRKARREDRLRRERAASNGEDGSSSAVAVYDQPPSYDQLFGTDCETPRPLHSRSGSTDGLLTAAQAGSVGRDNVAALEALEAEEDGLRLSSHAQLVIRDVLPVVMETGNGDIVSLNSSTTRQGASGSQSSTNTVLSPLSISTISGSEVADVPRTVFAQPGSTSANSSSSTTATSSNSAPSSSNQSASLSQVDGQSGIVSPQGVPPPSYAPWRRLPGMHISIGEFFANLMGGSSHSAETEIPPPSYEEALKILEKAKLEQEKYDRNQKLF